MRPLRAAAAGAVLALAGCDGDDELLVYNAGSQWVLLEVVCISTRDEGDFISEDHDHRFFSIPPDTIFVKDFGNVERMEVFVTYESSGLLLFADTFDGEDFADDHGRIEIVVNP